jgi:hypothetical protein
MKKLFTFLLLSSLAAHVLAQPLVMTYDSTHCSGDAASLFTCDNYIRNNTGAYANLKWTRYEMGMPAGWQTTVCDKNNCYSAATSTKNFSLNQGDSGFIKVNFIPNNMAGSGLIKMNVSSLDNMYSVDSYFFGSTTTGTAAPTVQEVKDILVYPTPVRENAYVVFNPSIRPDRLEVYNLLGQKVKSVPVQLERNSYRAEIQLSELDKGLYFLRVYQSNSNQVITRQFTKE